MGGEGRPGLGHEGVADVAADPSTVIVLDVFPQPCRGVTDERAVRAQPSLPQGNVNPHVEPVQVGVLET